MLCMFVCLCVCVFDLISILIPLTLPCRMDNLFELTNIQKKICSVTFNKEIVGKSTLTVDEYFDDVFTRISLTYLTCQLFSFCL